MLKHRNRLLTAAGAAAAAGAAVISGVTAAGAASSSASRIEHFQFMEAAISPTTTVIAHGAFTASGVDHTGDSIDTIVFSAGTFKFRHSPGKGPTRFNAKTCLAARINTENTRSSTVPVPTRESAAMGRTT